jgi:uncharacterized protein (TIGR03435 family)
VDESNRITEAGRRFQRLTRIEAVMSSRGVHSDETTTKAGRPFVGTIALCAGILAIGPASLAQPAHGARPKFEVASIKPCKESAPLPGRKGGGAGGRSWSPGRLSLSCANVENLIQDAYLRFAGGRALPTDPHTGIDIQPLPMHQMRQAIQGGPGWLASERYTIEAKAETAAGRETMLGPMMQSLLEDRFALKIHRETRDTPVYVLTVAKDGPKMQPTKEGSCVRIDFKNGPPPNPEPGKAFCGFFRSSGTGQGMDTLGQTMPSLSNQFSAWLDRDVIDKTGLSGAYDIHLDLSAADVMPSRNGVVGGGLGDGSPPDLPPDPLGAVIAAVQRLGLKLTAGKEPGAYLVIDHIERPPVN